jgi:ubiquinone/menaquinone biosynthesis C-methylase UbiE
MKDNFSQQAATYANFRPSYPQILYDFILQHVDNQGVVWDCATGNGQAAKALAAHFKQVYATDMSAKQVENAVQKPNITYDIQPAEYTNFPPQYFDLITVAQAAHWFNFDKFYAEVRRVAKPQATIAIWGYGMSSLDNPTVDALFQHFYKVITHPYWDKERAYVDAHYKTLPFPFQEIETPNFTIKMTWDLQAIEGYLNSWSAVQHFIRQEGYNPVDNFMTEIRQFWTENETQTVRFPVFLKLAKVF